MSAERDAEGMTMTTNDEVTELCNDYLRRAEAADVLARGYAEDDDIVPHARCSGKASAYRHAAELLRASPLAAEVARVRSLLGAAARGELPRCDDCGTRLATLKWEDTGDAMCDECLRELRYEHTSAGETLDEAACVDLPHAATLRAAIGGAK